MISYAFHRQRHTASDEVAPSGSALQVRSFITRRLVGCVQHCHRLAVTNNNYAANSNKTLQCKVGDLDDPEPPDNRQNRQIHWISPSYDHVMMRWQATFFIGRRRTLLWRSAKIGDRFIHLDIRSATLRYITKDAGAAWGNHLRW